MSSELIFISSEEIPNSNDGEEPSLIDASVKRLGKASTELALAPKPRRYDIGAESLGATFEIDHNDSQYHIPIKANDPLQTQHQREVLKCKTIQTGLEFKGNVKGIKLTVTQVASKEGEKTFQNDQPGVKEQKAQPQSQEEQNRGRINQIGAHFYQALTDANIESSQSAGGKDIQTFDQNGVVMDGDVINGSFICDQRMW